jgi:2,4-didehydro-3-deoxy-L-rhamnonate hydrolase
MKLIRFGEPGKERPGLLLSDGTRIDTSGFRPNGVFAYDEEFFASDGLAQLRQWIASHVKAAPGVAPSVRLGPPSGRPSKIVCIGLNFRDHAAESWMELPKEPVIFFESTTSLVGPNDPLVIPRGATKVPNDLWGRNSDFVRQPVHDAPSWRRHQHRNTSGCGPPHESSAIPEGWRHCQTRS